jgi:histone-arginine methyltransferase CARM1
VFRIDNTGIMHGLGCWFDANFIGREATVVLSTSPDSPTTHWYQCRLLMRRPIAVNEGQSISGVLKFAANDKFSYTISMSVSLDGTGISTENVINLQDQIFSYA